MSRRRLSAGALAAAFAAIATSVGVSGPSLSNAPEAVRAAVRANHGAQQASGVAKAAQQSQIMLKGLAPTTVRGLQGRPWPWWVAAGRKRTTQERKAARGRR